MPIRFRQCTMVAIASSVASAASGQVMWMGGAEPPSCDNCWRVADNWSGGLVPGIDPSPPGGPDDLRGVDVEITSGVSPVRGNQSGTQLGNLTSTLPLELTASFMTISGDALFTDTQFGSAILPVLNLFVGGGATLDGSSTLQNARFRGGPYTVNGPALVQDVPLNTEEVILDATVMTIEAAVTADSDIQFDNGAQLIINDTWTASGNSADLGAFAIDADEGAVEVSGEFVAAGGDVDINVPASGSGTIKAQAGMLSINAGGSFDATTFEAADGAELILNAQEPNPDEDQIIAGDVTTRGDGAILLSGSPFIVGGSVTNTAVDPDPGDGEPAGLILSSSDDFRLVGPIINNGDTALEFVTITGPSKGDGSGLINNETLRIPEGAQPVLRGQIVNNKAVDHRGELFLSDGVVRNRAEGSYSLREGAIGLSILDSGEGRFVNDGGTLLVPEAPFDLQVEISAPLEQRNGATLEVNRDEVDAIDPSLVLRGGGEWGEGGGTVFVEGEGDDGILTDPQPARLSFAEGDYAVTADGHTIDGGGACTLGGAATLSVAGGITLENQIRSSLSDDDELTITGQLRGPGTLRNLGNMRIWNGAASEGATVRNEPAGRVALLGAVSLDGTVLNLQDDNNSGFLDIVSQVTTAPGTVIDNHGSTLARRGSISGAGSFVNRGTVEKGTTTLDFHVDVRFDNRGLVAASAGNIIFSDVVQYDEATRVLDGGIWIATPDDETPGRILFTFTFGAGSIGPNTVWIGRGYVGSPTENIAQILGGVLGINGDTDFDNDLSNVDGGTFQVENGSDVTAPTITNGAPDDAPDGPSILDEMETAPISIALGAPPPPTITTALLTNHARLLPGGDADTGPLLLTADLAQGPTGRLLLDVAGPDDLDRVTITDGEATLAGTLQVSLLDGYQPQPGDEFVVLTADQVNGVFDATAGPVFAGNLRLVPTYSPTAVTLVCTCAADLTEPIGALDFSDVLAFLDAFGAGDPSADLAEPLGTLDFSDVLAFIVAFAAGCP